MSKVKLKAKGILFDLDGTIVNSKRAYLEAAWRASQALGQKKLSVRLALQIPKRLEQNQPIGDIVGTNATDFLCIYLKTFYAITESKTDPLPGIQTTLENLQKKAKLALITMRNIPKTKVTEELNKHDLSKYFSFVVTALDTRNPKPSPEAIEKTLRAMGVKTCESLVVGDSPSDIKAGKAARAKTVAVTSGLYSRRELAKLCPDLILKNANELPSYVE